MGKSTISMVIFHSYVKLSLGTMMIRDAKNQHGTGTEGTKIEL